MLFSSIYYDTLKQTGFVLDLCKIGGSFQHLFFYRAWLILDQTLNQLGQRSNQDHHLANSGAL